jgi:ABC-type nitrate/sulfonate/bicarbonate transport system substrate-binding protein
MKFNQLVRFTVVAALVVVAGCTASPAAPKDADAGPLTRIDVGVLPIIDDAPVFIALQRGLFRAQGLDVTPVILDSGEASTAELLSGNCSSPSAITSRPSWPPARGRNSALWPMALRRCPARMCS